MTDKELDEKADCYINNLEPDTDIGIDNSIGVYFEETVKEAYLAGAKDNAPQWHNLEKDPNDLPKENHFVFICNARFGYSVARYAPFNEFYCKTWVTNDNTNIPPEKVFAWCEILKFEEQE